MGWLITLGILVLLWILPLGVKLAWGEEGLGLKLRVAFVTIPLNLNRLLSGTGKEKKKEPGRPEDPPVNPDAPKKPRPRLNFEALKPWISLGADFLGDLRRKLRVDRLEMNLVLAGQDPCDLAIAYGSTCAAAANLQTALNRLLVIRDQNIQVQCDFTAEKTRASARLELQITLGRAVTLAVGYGIRAVRQLRSMENRKGGA